jgi:hypothetical protein
MSQQEQKAIRGLLKMLQRLSAMDRKTGRLLCFGYHVLARKKPCESLPYCAEWTMKHSCDDAWLFCSANRYASIAEMKARRPERWDTKRSGTERFSCFEVIGGTRRAEKWHAGLRAHL